MQKSKMLVALGSLVAFVFIYNLCFYCSFLILGGESNDFSIELSQLLGGIFTLPFIVFLVWKLGISFYTSLGISKKASVLVLLTLIVGSLFYIFRDFILYAVDYDNLYKARIIEVFSKKYVWHKTEAVYFITSVFVFPVIYEIYFRGIVTNYLLKYFAISSVLLFAVFFAVTRLFITSSFSIFLYLFFMDVGLTYLFYKKQSLALNIVLHVFCSFIGFMVLDLTSLPLFNF